MKGPKVLAAAIVAFFAISVLGVHLLFESRAGARGVSAAVPADRAAEGPVAVLVVPDPGTDERPAPAPVPSAARERELNDCVERNVHGPGYDDVKPTLPGRWPALKRARELRRIRRLQVREACEQGLVQ